MIHTTRVYLGSALLLAIGCAELSQLTPDQRVQMAVKTTGEACRACGNACSDPSVVAVCKLFAKADAIEQSEGPISGDGGPVGIVEERKADVGPHEGQGVRAVGEGARE